MRRVLFGLITTLLGILAVGCAAAPPSATAWVSAHGGLTPSSDFRQARIDAVSQKLIAACMGRHVTVQILATDVVTAFSLWDGHVFVTRGLADHLDDAEIQAAVAHELGHLLSDGHVCSVASLRGSGCTDPDREVRADAVGAELLKSQGLSPTAMATMLGKIEMFGSLSPACTIDVNRRISILLANPAIH